ncbi:37519_t:CDS:2, partial [Gigaspora margarita]
MFVELRTGILHAGGSQQRTITQKGLSCLAQAEGFCSKCYQDSECNWTIGYGSKIGKANKGKSECKKMEPINKDTALAKAKNFANTDSVGYVRVKKPLNNDQFDALLILAYNYPRGAEKISDYINTNGFSKIRDVWMNLGNGLKNRRKFE